MAGMIEKVPLMGILASGSGSTAERVIIDTQTGVLRAEISHLVTNNSNAGVIDRVARLNAEYGLDIELVHVSGKTHPDGAGEPGTQTLAEAEEIRTIFNDAGIGLVAMLGYMKEARGSLLEQYGWWPHMTSPFLGNMLNTHPGLLPATRGYHGLGVQEFAIREHHTYAGQTLHLATAGYDTGPSVAEHRILILPEHTPETLFDGVQAIEKDHIGADINSFLQTQIVMAAKTHAE